MTKKEYQSSKQVKDFLDSIKKAIEEKVKIQENTGLTSEKQAEEISELSEDLMKSLRHEFIRVPSEYVNSFMYTKEELDALLALPFTLGKKRKFTDDELKNYYEQTNNILNELIYNKDVTIAPSIIRKDDYKGDIIIVFGNSFGPFNPEKYCKQDLKILWLLKEPLIKSRTSWLKGDRGGHNQALYNQTWEKMEENPTVENLIKITREILQIVNERKYTEQEAMEHICILEVNHFPGLAFQSSNSNDDLIGEWAQWNEELIRELIGFYNPNIIIGAQSFMGYFTSNLNLLNWFSDSNNNENSVYEDGCPNIIFKNIIKKTWGGTDKHSMVRTEDGRYWINAYHPGVYGKNLNILNTNITKFAEELKIDKNPEQENKIHDRIDP